MRRRTGHAGLRQVNATVAGQALSPACQFSFDDSGWMGPKTWPNTWLVSGLGVDNHRRWWRLRASHNSGGAPVNERLVRTLLRHFGVSAHSVALEKIRRHHNPELGPFRHRRSHYCDRAAGFENGRARHIPYRLLTMLERRLLLVFSNSQQASASSQMQLRQTVKAQLPSLPQSQPQLCLDREDWRCLRGSLL